MSASHTHPTLRLVRGDAPTRDRGAPGRDAVSSSDGFDLARVHRERAARRVAEENLSAASLSALDPRWVLAVQASREIQGGRAAVLTPEGRRRLLLVGERLGLRDFDSNLVIAIVQDGARHGEDPLGSGAVSRLRLVGGDPELADARAGWTGSQILIWVMVGAMVGSALTLILMRLMA